MRLMSPTVLSIVSIGECTIDDYLQQQRQFVGGISLNFAVNAKRCGADRVSLVSRIGNDHQILQKLQSEGIDSSYVSVVDGKTARQNIILNDGERIFPPGGYQPGVLEGFTLNQDELQFVKTHNVIVCALFKQVEALFYRVILGMPFDGWFVADFLDLSDYNYDTRIVELNIERLKIAFISGNREMVERLRPLSITSNCLIVITLGAEGSVALIHGEPMHQPAIPVLKVVDTTGSGDAFQAAFTVSYWRNKDPRTALECGAQQAAKVIQHLGAVR
jgi:sugar/nucleoside kinase (ribokinase family)